MGLRNPGQDGFPSNPTLPEPRNLTAHVSGQHHGLDGHLGAAPQPLVHLAEAALAQHLQGLNLLRLGQVLHVLVVQLGAHRLDAV